MGVSDQYCMFRLNVKFGFIALAAQKTELFRGSIRDNIVRSLPEAADQAVETAGRTESLCWKTVELRPTVPTRSF